MEKTETNETEMRYPIFRFLCPELSDEEFASMRTVVCGWLFTTRVPKA